jgi:UDP-N-acetylglucosamine--N-acetylmuramyl-(pentapeptide) pyrophosphoryl-undecaprenol N-acetylglucosamine transferase
MALVKKDAALLVKDAEAKEQLMPLAIKTALDIPTLQRLGSNAKDMALPDSARIIAEEVIKLAKKS